MEVFPQVSNFKQFLCFCSVFHLPGVIAALVLALHMSSCQAGGRVVLASTGPLTITERIGEPRVQFILSSHVTHVTASRHAEPTSEEHQISEDHSEDAEPITHFENDSLLNVIFGQENLTFRASAPYGDVENQVCARGGNSFPHFLHMPALRPTCEAPTDIYIKYQTHN